MSDFQNDFPSSMKHLKKVTERLSTIGLQNNSWKILKQMKDILDDDFWSDVEKLQHMNVNHNTGWDADDEENESIMNEHPKRKAGSKNVYNLKHSYQHNKANINPEIDVYQTIGKVIVSCALPGLDKNSLKISLTEGRFLMLEGKIRKHDFAQNSDFIVQQERYYGKFSRQIRLPCYVKSEGVTRTYKNGILEIIFSKVMGKETKNLNIEW